MKTVTTPSENHQVVITTEIDTSALDAAKVKAAKRLGRNMRVAGFRPGKAPYAVLTRQIGEANILSEALDKLVDEIYPKAIEESGIDPYGPGSLKNIDSEKDPITFEFLVPLAPEVTLGDYKSIRKNYEIPEVTDKDVVKTIENLQSNQAVLQPVERAAEETDMVYISLKGDVIAEETEEGEEKPAHLANESYLPVVLRSTNDETSDEWPFPGFSRLLIGAKKGDTNTIQHGFPEDFDVEDLKGKSAEFTYEVKEIKSRSLPELNDEFAQSIGEYETLDDLKEAIQNELESRNQDSYSDTFEDELLTEIISGSEYKYPPQMIEDEISTMVDQLKSRLNQQQLDLETYLKSRQQSETELREELTPVAEERIKRGLTLMHIANAEKIEVDSQKIQSEISSMINMMSGNMKARDKKKLFTGEVVNNMITNAMSDALIKNTFEYLKSMVTGELDKTEESAEKDSNEVSESESEEEPPVLEVEADSLLEEAEEISQEESEV